MIIRNGKDPLDRYYTPEWAVKILKDDWPFQVPVWNVWEPCCGIGNIAKVLSDSSDYEEGEGLDVWASDIDNVDPDGLESFQFDFLRDTLDDSHMQQARLHEQLKKGTIAIVTNPPYTVPGATAASFVRKALEYTPYVAMLLRLTWIEAARDRASIFETNPPAEIWAISPRVNFTTPDGKESKNANMISCWFIWKPGAKETVLKWVKP